MSDTQYDRAPGDATALPDVEQGTSSGVLVYTIGLALAVVLTAMSFMALAFGVLIVVLVVVGSLLIMTDLNDNMMPAAELMNLQMQH
jgi:cytochrome o ubiquinol oxidase subunit IV